MGILFLLSISMIISLGNSLAESQRINAQSTKDALLKQTNESETEELLPQKVKDYVAKQFPAWSMASSADYHPLWWSFNDRSHHPASIVADFNDDMQADYVLLLKRAQDVKLVFLLGKGESFEHQVAEGFPESNDNEKGLEVGLYIEPPGRIDVVYPEEKSLILKSNGIAFMHFEVKTRIYYWSEGAFSTFRMR